MNERDAMKTKRVAVLSAVILLSACGSDPKAGADGVKKSVDSLNAVEKALHFIGLWPSYECGDAAPVAAANVASHLRERVGCGIVTTESDDSSSSVVLSFPDDSCYVDGKKLTGKARLRFSQGDDRLDARFDLNELKVDGDAIPLAVSVGECGDMMTYSIQGSAKIDHDHTFALDLTTQLRAGIPLIGHDDLVLDGFGELDNPHSKDQVAFEQVKMELGEPIPNDGQLKIDTEDGHHISARFFDGWPVGGAEVQVDQGDKTKIPL
ncbi:MAG: hypothetical protein QM723_05435 [Myxococcaceae bacterium]